jgi:hypothetical protein
MIKTVLDKCVSGLKIDSSDLVGWWGFGEYSGEITFNEKLDDPKVDSFLNGNLNASKNPLYNLCDTDIVNGNPSGSGYFDGTTILQVGANFPNKDYTIFVEYSSEDFTGNYDKSRTLFSTMDSCTGLSGMSIGLNGCHKPYIEYINENGHKKIISLQCELGKRNILSFARNSDSDVFTISHHDYLYNDSSSQSFSVRDAKSGLTDMSYADSLYVGDFFQTGQAGYTGFSGYMNNLIIFNKFLSSEERPSVSKCILASDYSGSRFTQVEVLESIITGSTTSGTGVIGTGITGTTQALSGTTQNRCGDDIDVYVTSGMTGELTGIVYTYTTGTAQVTGYRNKFVAEQVFFDDSRRLEFKRKNLVIMKPHDSGIDDSELQIFTGIETGIGLEARVDTANQRFNLDTGYIYINNPFQFFRNGLFQNSGTSGANGLVASKDYFLSGTGEVFVTGGVNENNVLDWGVYDVVQGSSLSLEWESGVSATSYSGDYLNKDLYFNGQKLESGHEWSAATHVDGTEYVSVGPAELSNSTGELSFVARASFSHKYSETDSNCIYSSLYATPGLANEMLWFNGQRLKRNKDYLIISENSLLSTGEYVRYNDAFSLYSGQSEGISYS